MHGGAFPPGHTPLWRSECQNISRNSMVRMEGSEPGRKTDEYLLKLKSVGLDSDPYDLPKKKCSTDINIWPEINFGDIYMYLISSPGKYTHESLEAWKSLGRTSKLDLLAKLR